MSIGCNCTVAIWLKGQRLRKQSLLFDWTRSTLQSVVDVLTRGLAWHLGHMDDPGYPVDYPHHPGNRAYKERCARRFFDVMEHAQDLLLVHCSPHTVRPGDLAAVEHAVALHRQDFRVLCLYGFKGKGAGVVSRTELSPRTAYLTIDAPKEFNTNRMTGEFYDDLARKVLPAMDRSQIYVSGAVEVEDVDPA